MRLTNRFSVMGRKYDLAYGQANTWKRKLKNDRYELIENAIDKLGQLEDIEEKIGIDLVTLFKAFNGLYYRKDNEIKFSWHIALVDWTIYILEESVEIEKGVGLGLTEYGKTWALTKEELLND